MSRLSLTLIRNPSRILSSFTRRHNVLQRIGNTRFVAMKDVSVVSPFMRKSRNFSSSMGTANMNYFPQFTIFGDTGTFQMKFFGPTLKTSGENSRNISVDRNGRIIFEFSPLNEEGKVNRTDWSKSIGIALSPIELGSLMSKLSRDETFSLQRDRMDASKILTVHPSEKDGSKLFNLTFNNETVIDVVVTAGNLETFKLLVSSSIPKLTGWSSLLEKNLSTLLERNVSSAGSYDTSDDHKDDLFSEDSTTSTRW